MLQKLARILFVVLIVGFGLLSPVVQVLLTRSPSVSPAEAMEALSLAPDKTLLVDVRKDNAYGPPVLESAVKEALPERLNKDLLRSKDKVFVICNTGRRSSAVVRDLRKKGFGNVFSVAGGMEAWLAGRTVACKTSRTISDTGVAGVVKRNALTRFEQFIICFTSFGLKPLYEILALVIAVVIWKRPESHWRTLRWAMVAFFLGENACAVNYLFYGLENFTWEFWHCYGMLVAFGLTFHALLDFVDRHLVHYSQKDKTCAFVDLCRGCYKYKPVACNLWVFFLFAIPALLVLCFMPLSAHFRNFMSIGTVYGGDVLFTHSMMQQWYEVRVYPLIAMAFLVLAWLVLIKGKEAAMEPAKALFAAALGVMGFSMMRFIIFWSYSDNILWAEAWEEITEFMFILAIVVLLCARRINGWIRPAAARVAS